MYAVSFEQCHWRAMVNCPDGMALNSILVIASLFGNSNFHFGQKSGIYVCLVGSVTLYKIVDDKYPLRIPKYRGQLF